MWSDMSLVCNSALRFGMNAGLDLELSHMLCCLPCSKPKQAVPGGQQQHQGSAPAVAAAEAGLLKPVIAAAVKTGTEPLKAAAELHAQEHAGEVTPSSRQEDPEPGLEEGPRSRWGAAQLSRQAQAAATGRCLAAASVPSCHMIMSAITSSSAAVSLRAASASHRSSCLQP